MGKLSNAVHSVVLNTLSLLKTSNEDYCDIETVDSGYNLVLKNGSLMSLFKYEGMMSLITVRELFEFVDHLERSLATFMVKPGYKIACIFRKDLDSYSLLENTEKIQKSVATRVGLNLDDLIDENVNIYANGVYNEEVWFAVITQPMVLDKIDKETVKEASSMIVTPALKNSQNIFRPLDMLRAKHQTFASKFLASMSNKAYHTRIEPVNVLEALNFIKKQFVPNYTHKKWMPSVVIGKDTANYLGFSSYRTPVMWPIGDNPHDMSHLFPANISRQLMGSHTISVLGPKENLPLNTVSVGGRLYTGVIMDVAPNKPEIFDNLFAAFNSNASVDLQGRKVAMPWSCSFLISSDGMASQALKNALSSVMLKIPPVLHNNPLAQAVQQLSYLKNIGKPVVSLQMSAMTWVDDTEEQRKELKKRKQHLQSTLETWGGLTTKDNVGDPIMLQKSNILGLGQEHVGTKVALPLADAFERLPITRPATPFNNGTILHKTLDGKLMTLEHFSPQQNTWITLITGVPGSGKSVLMNKLLYEACLTPGISRLPYISIIDKGISSQGFINLLRDRLPPEKRHLVTTRRLRKDRSSAINPFDIKPGLTRPLESERTQMVNFLTTLMTPPEDKIPYNGTINFCSEIIDIAFEKIQEVGPHAEPKMYRANFNEELDSILQEFDVIKYETIENIDQFGRKFLTKNYKNILEDISYFALVRKLHVMGERSTNSYAKERLWRGRDIAQRYGVPILQDFIPIIESDTIKTSFKNKINTGETMPEYAIRCIRGIMANYECFTTETQFDVDSSRVMALDLQDVIDKNNPMQTALFYQAARMVSVKKYSLSAEDVREDKIPALFLPYYRNLLRNLTMDRKILAYDEFHNAKEDFATMKQVEVDAREGRKWGVGLVLASQYIQDFVYGNVSEPVINLIGFATTLCICSQPSENDLYIFKDSITDHAGILESLERIGISAHGLTYFAQFRTKTGKFQNFITNQVGNQMMWSLTTDAIDRSMREAMLTKIPDMKKALKVLSWVFGGSVASAYKERSMTLGENITEAQKDNLISAMADEAIHFYNNHNPDSLSSTRI